MKSGEENNKEEITKKADEVVDTGLERYPKANILIGAKYRSSLLENKIMAISLSKIQKREFMDEGINGGLVCELRASELKELLNANSGSFYQQLDPIAYSMTSRSIGITNPEEDRFEYIAVITNAKYENGVFSLRYNYSLKSMLDSKKNFTLLSLPTMLSFKGNYAFRLYELIRSKAYVPKGKKVEAGGQFKIEFKLSELKLEMGVVNAELDSVRKILNGKSAPDYDKAVEKSPEQTFKTWYEFRRRVLVPAVKEINEKTELNIEFEPKKGGVGSKVYGVTFFVSYKEIEEKEAETIILDKKEEVKRELTEDEEFEFFMSVRSMIKEKLSVKDVRAISKASNYELSRIVDAYELMKDSGVDIENVTGWLITAIKENYTVVKKTKKKKKESEFKNFQEKEYDFQELEKKLIQ